MMLYKICLFCFLVNPLVSAQDLPHIIYRDTLGDVGDSDVPGPPITDEEMEASLLDASLLEPPPEDSPLWTQTQYFQGDIILQDEDELAQLLLNNDTDIQNAATTDPNRNWPGGLVPYVITSHFWDTERAVIARAMAEFKKKTCVRFIPKERKHHDYININNGNGCSSSRGMMKGRQNLNLGKNCVYFGTVIHELMHAIGFIHEQSRHDRDDHVTINFHNIVKDMSYNFDKVSKSVTHDLGLPYDLKSVMHYGKFAFAKNPRIQTITAKHGVIKGQNGFSKLDLAAVNLLYSCCIDTDASCSAWAKKGECQKSSAWMSRRCKKSCNTCGSGNSRIPLTASNIVDHGGFRPGGAGPEKLLENEGFWNPNPKPWFVVFDVGQSHLITSFQVKNYGDTTHDMTAFKLDASEDLKSWARIKTVNNVQIGTAKIQTYELSASGAGRYWRFTVTATAKGFQPYLKNVAFFGSKRHSSLIPLTASSIVDHGGFRPGGAGPEKLLQNEGFWNPNPKPWFVVFDMGQTRSITSFQITNFGDTTHDMLGFKLEASKDKDSWPQVKLVPNVEVGTDKVQTFKLSGTGRFWRFTVMATAKGFQPYLKRVAFFGF